MQERLGDLPGILAAQANPVTGRLLILHEPGLAGGHVTSLFRACLREVEAQPPPARAPQERVPPLARVLRAALPGNELVGPVLLSVASHSLHLLRAGSFISIVDAARGGAASSGVARRSSVSGRAAWNLLLTAGDVWLKHRRRQAWRRVAQQTQHNLRSQLFARLTEQDLAFFDHHGTGDLIQRLTEDTARIGELVERAGDEGIENALALAVSFTALATLSLRLLFLATLPLPVMLVVARLLRSETSAKWARAGRASGQFHQALETSLSGVDDIKSFTAETRENDRVGTASREWAAAAREAQDGSALQSEIGMGLFSAGFSLVAAQASLLASAGKITPSELNRALYWFPYLLRSLTGLTDLTRLNHAATEAALRVGEMLESQPRIVSGGLPLPTRTVRGEVVFEDVSFSYTPGTRVIDGISFHLRPGETLAIVGRTGSGKSTLLRLLLRLYDVGGGAIYVDGHDLRELDLRDLRQAIGVVSQNVHLFQGTLRENLQLGRDQASDDDLLAALQAAELNDLLEILPQRLDAEIGEHGRRFSSGQRQRVAIARALLKGAPVLALDEPTSHLDYDTEAAVLRFLRRETTGRSVLLIAHRLATVRHADRILVLDRGRICEQGTHAELLRRDEFYAALWRLQSGEAAKKKAGRRRS